MKIYTHRAKNDLTAWASDKVWGPNKIWGARYQLLYPLENFLSEALARGAGGYSPSYLPADQNAE